MSFSAAKQTIQLKARCYPYNTNRKLKQCSLIWYLTSFSRKTFYWGERLYKNLFNQCIVWLWCVGFYTKCINQTLHNTKTTTIIQKQQKHDIKLLIEIEMLEKNEEAVKNGQSREKRRGSQEWTIQRNGQHCPQHT